MKLKPQVLPQHSYLQPLGPARAGPGFHAITPHPAWPQSSPRSSNSEQSLNKRLLCAKYAFAGSQVNALHPAQEEL